MTGGGDVSWDLINATWDAGDDVTKRVGVTGRVNLDCHWNAHYPGRTSTGDTHLEFHSGCDFDTSTVNVGGKLDASVSGDITLSGEAAGLQGSASVSYPGDVALSYPSVDSFLAGETVSIGSGWTLGAGATIDAAETRGDLRLNAAFDIDSDVDVTVYAPGTSTGSVVDVDWQGDFTVFSFSALDPVPPIPAVVTAGVMSGDFGSISVQPAGSTVSPSGSISVSGTNEFSSINIDLDRLANLFGAPLLGGCGKKFLAGVCFDLLDADANVDLDVEQTLTFDPDVLVRLDFAAPVGSITGPYRSVDPGLQWVVFEAGQQIDVTLPAGTIEPIAVTPSIYLENEFTNETELRTESYITLSAGNASFTWPDLPVTVFPKIGGFKVCGGCRPSLHDGSFHFHDFNAPSFGPWRAPTVNFDLPGEDVFLWGPQDYLGVVTPDELANDTFSLGGFSTVQLASFLLDPEVPPEADAGGPYSVDEGDSVTLTASELSFAGSDEVDIDGQDLTYAWDLDDDGTFETAGRVVDFPTFPPANLDGPETYLVTVHVCDYLNCDNASATVTVVNVPPVTTAAIDTEIVALRLVSLSPIAFFTDASDLDTHDATIDWDDGLVEPGALTQGAGSGSVDGSHVYSLPSAVPSDYTVEVCVTDDDGDTGCDTLIITVLGPLDLKDRAIDGLSAYTDQSKRIEKAIEEIAKSLEPALWVDSVHVDPKHGHKVFDRERHAVKELMHLIEEAAKGKKNAASPEAADAAAGAIEQLVESDWVLARTAVNDVEGLMAADPKHQGKVDREIAKAATAIADGNAARAVGKFDKAIDHYKATWKNAGLAAKHAAG